MANRYSALIERVFLDRYAAGAREVDFTRDELVATADLLNIILPKNVGDVVYSFRYRTRLPPSILAKLDAGNEWVISGLGAAQYRFRQVPATSIVPRADVVPTKIPNSTPVIVAMHAKGDEQAVLARIRYNRLVDLTTGVVAYSLQNHLRTTILGGVQIEIDELYVGVNNEGRRFIIPVQAKGGTDRIGRAQLDQDLVFCREKYPSLTPICIAAQFMAGEVICMFCLDVRNDQVVAVSEKHYKLVRGDEIAVEDLERLPSSLAAAEPRVSAKRTAK